MSSRTGREEILGRDEILGREEILGRSILDRQEIVGRDEILGSFVGRQEIIGREEILGRDEILGAFVGDDETAEQVAKRRQKIEQQFASHAKYLTPGFESKKITRADIVKYLNSLSPEVRSIAAANLVNSLRHSGVAIVGSFVGDDDRALAAEGGACEREALARRTSSGFNSHLTFTRGNAPTAEQIEELRARAEAGDARAQRRLEELRKAASKVSGEAGPVVDGLPHPTPLTAEQKEDIRTFLRHLPPVAKNQEKDYQGMTALLVSKYGAVREGAKRGDPAAIKKWGELIAWTNKLQDLSLKNDANALTHLRNISRTNLFNPRFRAAS
jgi:hypothetical protein